MLSYAQKILSYSSVAFIGGIELFKELRSDLSMKRQRWMVIHDGVQNAKIDSPPLCS